MCLLLVSILETGMGFAVDRDGVETRVIHDLVDFDGRSVLEVGCGDGRLTRRYAGEAARVVALDVNEEKVEAAVAALGGELSAKVSFRAGDIGVFDIGSGEFDVVILSYSL